ncbi:BQ2448_2629 [Microbotryum intermedium]|uniref:Dolichol phosphate-mannose biosynthesis regulatory protein n=1 Tax=Microbotryum intermedium TaxID=269621 RepID=A0A238FA30_9BASI|nr:BQ2448_2629 [Microbotryum intermedium]
MMNLPRTSPTLAGLMLSTAIVVFTYYTIWTLFTPFLPSWSPLINYFPAREWAIRIPALLMLSGLMTIGAFVGLILVKSSRQKVKAKVTPRRPVTSSTSGTKDRSTSSLKKL